MPVNAFAARALGTGAAYSAAQTSVLACGEGA